MQKGIELDGEKLRAWRTEQGLSQAELADRAGVAYATVNRIENGHTTSFKTIERLAEALSLGSVWMLETTPAKVRAARGRSRGNAAVVDLSDAGGVALMERVAAGETEEVRELEDRYVGFLPRYAARRGDRDVDWTMEAFERDLAKGLAALAAEDRAEAIQKALGRIREIAATENGGG